LKINHLATLERSASVRSDVIGFDLMNETAAIMHLSGVPKNIQGKKNIGKRIAILACAMNDLRPVLNNMVCPQG
jgi:hypothetical protein